VQHQQRIRSADLRLDAGTTVLFLGVCVLLCFVDPIVSRVGVDTEYVITRQVPVQRWRRGRLRRQLHAVRARRCARRLRERACAPPTRLAVVVNWFHCHQVRDRMFIIRSTRISLMIVCGFCTTKFCKMI